MSKRSRLACALALSSVSVAACGESFAATAMRKSGVAASANGSQDGAMPAEGSTSRPEDSTADPAFQRALSIAVAWPSAIAASAQLSRGMLVEAVYFATATTGAAALGQVTMTGTVTVGSNGAAYAPSPPDRLVVKLGSEVHEFVVESVQGNSRAENAADWMASPHVLIYTHKAGDRAEAQVAVQFDGARFDVKAKGWAKLDGQRYEVDLSGPGAVKGERDMDGHDITMQYDLTGEIEGGGLELAVKEHHVVQTAGSYSLRLLTTQRGTASLSRARVASVLKYGGATYRFADVDVRWEGVDKGDRQQSGVTAIAGAILRDEQPFATCALVGGAAVAAVEGKAIRLDGLPAK